eukprot:4168978-Prorocentrum_lima.AAC.1
MRRSGSAPSLAVHTATSAARIAALPTNTLWAPTPIGPTLRKMGDGSSGAQSVVTGTRHRRRATVSYTHLTLPTICSV